MKTIYKNMDNYVFAFRPCFFELAKKTIYKTIEAICFAIISIPLALYMVWIVFN
jgi:hypothetical protein